jgi:hypothetical protein
MAKELIIAGETIFSICLSALKIPFSQAFSIDFGRKKESYFLLFLNFPINGSVTIELFPLRRLSTEKH